MDRVVDELGLVRENEYLVLYIPATTKALVFRVVSRYNKGFEVVDYGPLPLKAGTILPTLDGGTTSVPEDGVLPARSYTPPGGIAFPCSGAYDSSDMWYVPEDYRDRAFHVVQRVAPAFLRIGIEVPGGVAQARFQKDRVVLGVEKDFGFTRGSVEVVHLPKVRYGYRYANDTNLDVYTYVRFTYGEYVVEVPRDAEAVFNVLHKKVPAHWVTIPVTVYDKSVEGALNDVYGFDGFKLYPYYEREKALSEYRELIVRARV